MTCSPGLATAEPISAARALQLLADDTPEQATIRKVEVVETRTLTTKTKNLCIRKIYVGIDELQTHIDEQRARVQGSPRKMKGATEHMDILTKLKIKVDKHVPLEAPQHLAEVNDRPENYFVQFPVGLKREVVESVFSMDVIASVWAPFGSYCVHRPQCYVEKQ